LIDFSFQFFLWYFFPSRPNFFKTMSVTKLQTASGYPDPGIAECTIIMHVNLLQEGREVEDDEIGAVGSQDKVTRKLALCSP
jgi:hypothetical protein